MLALHVMTTSWHLLAASAITLTGACTSGSPSETVPPGSSSSAPPNQPGPDSGGTPTKDGANGVCCPARIGGCALQGGYHADGSCANNEICDDMCEQRIVTDEHGCEMLTYKTPRVATTYSGPEACDGPPFTGGLDAGRDASDGGR
jgi:hypothetical protein